MSTEAQYEAMTVMNQNHTEVFAACEQIVQEHGLLSQESLEMESEMEHEASQSM